MRILVSTAVHWFEDVRTSDVGVAGGAAHDLFLDARVPPGGPGGGHSALRWEHRSLLGVYQSQLGRGGQPRFEFQRPASLRTLRKSVFYSMDIRISATELARNVGDVLGRIRYRGDSFLVERNGEAVARVVPLVERPTATLGEVVGAWSSTGSPEPDFARDLEEVGFADRPPEDPWGS